MCACRTWGESDAQGALQVAYLRIKKNTGIPGYTYAILSSATGGNSGYLPVAGAQMTEVRGVITMERC